jgi:hypothetical protein
MVLLAVASEPDRGWGGPLGIAVAFVIFAVGRWIWLKIHNPSPTPALPTAERVKAQARLGEQARLRSGGGGDVDLEKGDKRYSWGGISYDKPTFGDRLEGLKDVWRDAANRGAPDEDEVPEDRDPEIDLALDEDD